MSKINNNDKWMFPGGINSGVGGKLFVALTTDDVQVDATGVTIDMSASTAGAVWTMTIGSSTDTYTTAAVTSTTASKALTVSTGTSTPATAITGGATGALTARTGNSVANHASATGGVSGAASFGSGNASSTLGTSGASGAVTLSSGTSEDAATGLVTVASGAGAGATGGITLTTGNSSGSTSGDINVTTGTASGTRGQFKIDARRSLHIDDTPAEFGTSGFGSIVYGSSNSRFDITTLSVTSTTASKPMLIRTGTSTIASAATGGATGALTITSGASDVTDAGGTGGDTGAVGLGTGNASSTAGTTSGNTGALSLTTGNSADAGSGSISLTVGTAGGTRGNINLSATDIAVTGNLKTNDLAERGVDSGITLASGSEIVGVPKMVKFTTGYNVADVAAFTVPAGETWLITDVWHQTSVSWDGNGTAQVGVTADADGFLALANASLVTTYDESGGITGWPTGSRGLQFTNRGVLLAVATDGYTRHYRAVAGTTVLWDVTVGTSTVGAGTLYMTYIRLP